MLPIHSSKLSVFNYDEIPPGYYYWAMKKGKAPQQYWHRNKFKEVASYIQPTDKLLDIGCGPGSFLDTLAEQIPDVRAIGIDVASAQIDFANREIASKFNDGSITFRTFGQSVETLPFEENHFDKVSCIEVIEHIHPHYVVQTLQEARRVLKPNGRLILTTPNYRSAWPLIEFFLERLSPIQYHEQHINKLTPNSAVKIVESAGFEIRSVRTIFIIAPFLCSISKELADWAFQIEKKLRPLIGSLLIIEAQPMATTHQPQ